ncbi:MULTISPECIES: hypothetical protein [Erwiniaceae]|uniref:Uncharacterized protein n=1 Tax=Enterobacter agglomerans TaxID=549 RepID=A0ACC5RUC9_ENTAG|nr:hypothetical protein [Pantoea agglomerans]MBK4728102.1 hypothetical protein [Pantoea agglomerans]
MTWNTERAIQHLRIRANSASQNRCAEFTREAIEAGGIILARTRNAKDYGTSLSDAGFRELPPGSRVNAGDIVIIQSYRGGNPAGHMAMFDGSIWISDFRQRTMYPGPGYRHAQPSFKIYRMH